MKIEYDEIACKFAAEELALIRNRLINIKERIYNMKKLLNDEELDVQERKWVLENIQLLTRLANQLDTILEQTILVFSISKEDVLDAMARKFNQVS